MTTISTIDARHATEFGRGRAVAKHIRVRDEPAAHARPAHLNELAMPDATDQLQLRAACPTARAVPVFKFHCAINNLFIRDADAAGGPSHPRCANMSHCIHGPSRVLGTI